MDRQQFHNVYHHEMLQRITDMQTVTKKSRASAVTYQQSKSVQWCTVDKVSC